MTFALNTAKGTKHITLSLGGMYSGEIYNPTFCFSRALTCDENTLNIVSLDIMSLKHPAYYDPEYMDGWVVQVLHP